MKKQYYIEQVIKNSFNKYLDNIGAFMATSAITVGLYVLFVVLAMFAVRSMNMAIAVGSIIIAIIMIFLGIYSLFCQSLEVSQGKKTTFNSFNNYNDCIGNFILANIITVILTVTGIMLCYVPGLMIMSRLCLTPFYVLDKKMDALEAIKASWDATEGHTWNLVGANLLLSLIASAVAFISLPMQHIGLADIYQQLKEDDNQFQEINF